MLGPDIPVGNLLDKKNVLGTTGLLNESYLAQISELLVFHLPI